jgi:hypothetical protein
VASPLENLWENFTGLESWHNRVNELVHHIEQTSRQFEELRDFNRQLTRLDFDQNYERLWSQLREVAGFYRQQIAPQVNRMIGQREKALNVTRNDLRQRRGSEITPEEQLLLG